MGGLNMNIEFYTVDNELWYLTTEGANERFDETKENVISTIIDRLIEHYPEAYGALAKWYGKSAANVPYYRYLIARRFLRCNFGRLDTTQDDFGKSSFRFEKVECPLRGECQFEGVVCMPRFNSKLSQKELQVMRLIYNGCSSEEVSERLFLSPFTVKNHIKSVYQKLGIHDKSEFIRYANKNNVFS